MTNHSAAVPKIGVFDSGVGGLSVLKAIRREHPIVDFIYIADSGNAPYGSRPAAFIESRAHQIAERLVDAGAQVIVVACNTATAVAVARLRSHLPVPIIAMEPAIKPAVAQTKTGVVGVLATERTIESANVARLCRKFGQGVNVLLQPCPGLVEFVERGELSSARTREYLRMLVIPLMDKGTDTLVLGCTHYVFLESEIRDIAGPAVQIIESSAAVARQTLRHIGSKDIASAPYPGRGTFLTTGSPDSARVIFSQLWGAQVEVGALENSNVWAENRLN
ncbi:glutamate racemase [Candidatus Methylospira mobilis]|uniref:Glutamate racemase n=1 Tax=Candidatus Methylospira mobilis TaxID=1808979 RepID=A0A5Q0BKQ1_9GAMM|nr:glutamate racemase [Candidatus Methylospira mobilis]QFY44159.1 glutamate racemase [Candidatus Methylospira mobilis]WNV06422.1 glutamate racemase [Candidatus Methylospira mobilis]